MPVSPTEENSLVVVLVGHLRESGEATFVEQESGENVELIVRDEVVQVITVADFVEVRTALRKWSDEDLGPATGTATLRFDSYSGGKRYSVVLYDPSRPTELMRISMQT